MASAPIWFPPEYYPTASTAALTAVILNRYPGKNPVTRPEKWSLNRNKNKNLDTAAFQADLDISVKYFICMSLVKSAYFYLRNVPYNPMIRVFGSNSFQFFISCDFSLAILILGPIRR
jgi:hypothetical protein